jgi:hypothetical protein
MATIFPPVFLSALSLDLLSRGECARQESLALVDQTAQSIRLLRATLGVSRAQHEASLDASRRQPCLDDGHREQLEGVRVV